MQTSSACFGDLTLSEPSGYISDGYDQYPTNLNCGWILEPPGDVIFLEFYQFSTNPDDYVRVYEGDSSNGTLVGEYSGSEVPTYLISYTGSMYVEFTTSDTEVESRPPGFFAISAALLDHTMLKLLSDELGLESYEWPLDIIYEICDGIPCTSLNQVLQMCRGRVISFQFPIADDQLTWNATNIVSVFDYVEENLVCTTSVALTGVEAISYELLMLLESKTYRSTVLIGPRCCGTTW